jgi:phenylacetate-CoA ligase
MPIEQRFLETLCCPLTKRPLRALLEAELRELNALAARGALGYSNGEPVPGPLDDGLITLDQTTIYRMDQNVPVLLPRRGIPVGNAAPPKAHRGDAGAAAPAVDHWDRHARQWSQIGAPLRPATEDIDLLRRLIAKACKAAKCTAPRALLLGVTPEIAAMPWPSGTRLSALDHSLAMIRHVWPAPEGSAVACGEWATMPLRDGTFDVVTGDGCFSLLGQPEGYHTVAQEVRRVLTDNGRFLIRLFVRPDSAETLDRVFDDLRAGRIGNFHVFKWRLAMALHGNSPGGVRLDDIWNAWNEAVPDPADLAQKLGWPLETVRTIEAYRGIGTRYTFPTLTEAVELFSGCFERTACHVPDYELGDRCPTLVFKPLHRRVRKSVAATAKTVTHAAHSADALRTDVADIAWPALPGPRAAAILSVLYQLEASQWWATDRLLEHQLWQSQALLRHAYQNSEFWRQRLDEGGFDPLGRLTHERWSKLPLLTRRDIQNAGESLFIRQVAPVHGPLAETQTSGSTGQPVKVLKTSVTQLLWAALTLRDHSWHRRDATGKFAAIRAHLGAVTNPPHGSLAPDWGPPIARVYLTGPCAMLSMTAPISLQADWLARHDPHYLLTYPSNLMALIAQFRKAGLVLSNLRQIQSVAENVSPELRQACRETWNVPVIDMYSSQEVGYIALQCPDCESYHVQSESVLVEILNPTGQPCAPGEVGRVVVTDLHNFATPLIRYELADCAEAAPPCPCGRGLPTLARIVGRQRNLLTLPSGEQRWPLVGFRHFREIAPIRQFQFVQQTRDQIEVRFVADRPVVPAEEACLKAIIQEALGHPFDLSFVYLDEIPRSAGGKFEEFISKLNPV